MNNLAAGTFTILNGYNFTATGAFSNAGMVDIGASSIFDPPAASYTQTAGTTQMEL